MTIIFRLTKGHTTIIDNEDADLAQYKWYESHGYAVSRMGTVREKYLHRIILERKIGRKLRKGEDTDHINRNRLDNKRSNLRAATHAQNCRNQSGHFDGTSKYKGVCRFEDTDRWRASLGGQHIGIFPTEEEAAYAHDTVAREKHGKFAYLNFPNIHCKLDDLLTPFGSNNTSGYRGVYLDKNGYWRAEIIVKKKKYRLGSFRTAKEAAQAYDHKATELLGGDAILNFPDQTYDSPFVSSTLNLNNTSGYTGIYYSKKNKSWCAEITINRKKKYLGRYPTPEQAARAYDKAAKEAGRINKLNFPDKP